MVLPHRIEVIALRVGICFLALYASSGQERRSTLASASLRLSSASHVANSCAAVFSPSTVQEAIDVHLRDAGIVVSRVHTAQLAADVDCVAVGARGRNSAIAVQQCLGYSELVSAPSRKSGVTLANTWRKCQSFVCSGGRCEPSMRAGISTLMSSFLTDFERSTKTSGLAAPPPEGRIQVPAVLPSFTGNLVQRAVVSGRATVAFYSLYILACMVLMLYWQFRSSLNYLQH